MDFGLNSERRAARDWARTQSGQKLCPVVAALDMFPRIGAIARVHRPPALLRKERRSLRIITRGGKARRTEPGVGLHASTVDHDTYRSRHCSMPRAGVCRPTLRPSDGTHLSLPNGCWIANSAMVNESVTAPPGHRGGECGRHCRAVATCVAAAMPAAPSGHRQGAWASVIYRLTGRRRDCGLTGPRASRLSCLVESGSLLIQAQIVNTFRDRGETLASIMP